MLVPSRRLAVACIAVGAIAQEPAPPAAEPFAVPAAVEEWLAEPVGDRPLAAATKAVLDAGDGALRWLGGELTKATDPHAQRTKALRDLGQQVVLGFVERARGSGMVYAGQYEPLAALGPFASECMLHLLLETPDWFADTRRVELVAPLRDLLSRPPSGPQLLGIIDLVQNEEIEPDDLRTELGCMLWQWGRKEFVEPRLAGLRAATTEGDAEDRQYALSQLAQLQYRLRDYRQASATHASLQALAVASGLELSPTEWYWGACYHALAGRIDRGFAALERCVDRLASPHLDESLRLRRTLFERDPEIARLRADARFAPLFARAFPQRASGDGK